MGTNDASNFFEYARQKGAKFMDLKFVDLLGTWQHCTYPIEAIDASVFTEGLGFDGSSIRGWQDINTSDMIAVPDASTVMMDPFYEQPTVSVIANIVDPLTRKPYDKDPRMVARRGAEFLQKSGIADVAYIGPEPEFFIFDEVRYEQNQNSSYYKIDSVEGAWNTNRSEEPNLGYKPGYKGGYFPVSPSDTYHNLRGEMVQQLMQAGIVIEAHHHEVATGGQCEIDMKYTDLVTMADQFMWYKYIIKNVARNHGKTVTFMPKPIVDDNGSGMHTHFSLWKNGKNLFAGKEYAGLSKTGLYAIGGLLKHAGALLAFAAPTTNSYRRLVPGYEAPVNLVYSARNRSAAIRIPMYSQNPNTKRFEFRCPDATANGYLLWSAMLMAVMDGIINKIEPGKPLDKNIYQLSEREKKRIRSVPSMLSESLNALERDNDFLTRYNVFNKSIIKSYIDYKRENEINELAKRTHPYEFYLYYDN